MNVQIDDWKGRIMTQPAGDFDTPPIPRSRGGRAVLEFTALDVAI